MSDTYDATDDKVQQAENILKQLVEKSMYIPTVDANNDVIGEVLNFLKAYEDIVVQNKKFIELIAFELLKHCSFCNNFYVLFDKVLECAEKTGDADLLTKTYSSIFPGRDVNKNISIIEDGIRKLLLVTSKNSC